MAPFWFVFTVAVNLEQKKTANYFSSKNRFIQDKQRIAMWNQCLMTANHKQVLCNKERNTHLKREKEGCEGCSKQSPLEKLRIWTIAAFHCLSCNSLLTESCNSSPAELLPDKRRKSYFLLLCCYPCSS